MAVGRGDEVRWFHVRTGEFEKPAEEAKGGTVEDPGGQAAVEELAGMIQAQGGRSERQAEKIAKSLTRRPEQVSDDGAARMAYIDGELWFHRTGQAPRVLARGDEGRSGTTAWRPMGRRWPTSAGTTSSW